MNNSSSAGQILKNKKVLIIGLDGFTWNLGRDLIEDGVMPNLAKLVKEGCHGNLESVMPYETCPAWTSFQTGCYPGKTGVFAFHTYDHSERKVRLNSFSEISVPTLWELADHVGKTVVSLNMPLTSPPPKVTGIIIPGLLCIKLSGETVHPPEAYNKYIRPQERYRIINTDNAGSLRHFISNQVAVEQIRSQVALEIMQDVNWDIFAVQMQSIDYTQHMQWWALDSSAHGHCPRARLKVLRLYRRCDEAIGKIVSSAGPNVTTFIVSDHGFCPLKHFFFVNAWLRKHGYLSVIPPKTKPKSRLAAFKDHLGKRVPPMLKALARPYVKKILRLPAEPLFYESELAHLRTLIDYSKTRAFVLGALGGMLYIIGTEKERKELAEKIKEHLLREFGPKSAQPIIVKITSGKEFYGSESRVDTLPDLVLELAEGVSILIHPLKDVIVMSQYHHNTAYYRDKQMGEHAREGVLVVHGPNVFKGKSLDANIVDIVPTVLACLGIPIPGYVDGKVLKNAFVRLPKLSYEDMIFERSQKTRYTAEEQAQVERDLANLGYL